MTPDVLSLTVFPTDHEAEFLFTNAGLNFFKRLKENMLATVLRAVALLGFFLMSSSHAKAQTSLIAGDLVFSAFDATPSVADDKFSFILLVNITANTEIYFTDRGYANGSWQNANGNTEGGIKWVSGSALVAGTEVMIKGLSATVGGVSNGAVTSVSGGNPLGLSISHPSGDQIIAFQGGGGNPGGTGVTCIGAIHWNYCPVDWYSVYTTDAGWDNIGSPGSCGLSTNSSNVPPGLTGGVNAFWIGFYLPTAPAKDIQCYTKGQFNGVGAPFASMAALRTAVLNRNNWIPVKSNDAATVTINVPTSYTYASSGSVATLTTTAAASVGAKSATLGGNVTADGGATVTERGIVWATTSNPTTSNNKVSNGSGTGSFSATVSSLPPGTLIYVRAYAINSSGTSYGSNISFTTNAALSAGVSQNNVSCNGGSNATATVTPTGGKISYTYSWAPSGGTGATASGLAAGNYTCTITDAESTQITRNFTITQPTGFTVTTSQNNVSCNGGANGSATVNVSGASGSYIYSWSPSGGTSATASGLAAGNYTVTITDANSCQTTRNFTITQPSAITSNVSSQINVSSNGGSDGSATVSVSGGTPPYTYSWAPSGGTAATATGLSAGTYTVTITDANSCTKTQTVTITQPAGITSSISSQTNVSCYGGSNGSATITASGGTGALSYSWAPSGGTAATATGLAAGTYTVTITDANNTTKTQTVTIIEPAAFVVTTSQTNVSCNGGSNGSATVTVSGGTGAKTYSWAPSGGTSATASGLPAGNYTVTITDANSCQTTRSFTITQPAAFSVATSQINVSCNGGANGSATVNVSGASGPYTYSWAPSGGTGATASGLAAGNYTVTITDANTCQTTRNFTITQPAAFTVGTSQTNIACNGASTGSATVNVSGATGPYTYSWAPSGGTAATASGLAASSYMVTITDGNLCQTTRNFTITQPAAFTVGTSQTNVACNGASTGSATVNVSGATGPYTYSWSPSGGTAATASGLAAGNYTVTITDGNLCQTVRNFTITQPAAFNISTSQTNVSCNGGTNGSATVNVSGATGPYTYSWAPSGGTAATASGLAAGSYTVTITDGNLCQTTRNFTITQPVVLSATSSKTDVSCNGGADGTATVTASGGTGSYTYSWAPSGGTAAAATGLAAGTYTVTVWDANTCQTTQSVTINQPAAITVTATPSSQTICSGSATSISLSAVPAGADFNWTVTAISGNVTGASSGSGTSIGQTLTGSGVVKYTVTPAGSNCSGSTKEVLITINALTTVEMHPSDKSIYDEEAVKFAIEATNAETYQWQVDAGSGFTDIEDDAHYSGTNNYILKITDATGAMNGHLYRCVVTGNCDPVNSNSAKLTVKVRTAQVISFASTDEKVYGSPDFVPQAGSNAGLELAFTSSDESVASIENGKVHIKKAGQVTITASQAGNDDYKPAASVDQVLTIAKKQISVSLQATPLISKTYDGNTTATLVGDNYSLVSVVEGDDVSVTGTATYDNSNAGTDKDITVDGFVLSGTDKDNYTVGTVNTIVKGSIEKAKLIVSLQSSPLISKIYNGSDVATLSSANYVLNGILGEDEVTIASGKAAYSDKKAGYDKEITVTDFVLAGAQKNNYAVENSSAVTSGDIKAKEITAGLAATPAISKVYDGSDRASVPAAKYQLSGIETGDEVAVKGTAVYNNRHAGEDKVVTVNELVLDGADASNYQLSTTELSGTGSIEKTILTVTIVAGEVTITKEYDGKTEAILAPDNYSVEGIVGDDHVQLNNPTNGSYENKHGGEGKKVTVTELLLMGEDADNYTLASTIVSANVGKITRKVIGVTADAKTKVYGQADPALTYAAEGKLEGDVLPGHLIRTEGKNAGEYTIEQGTLDGGDDYLIEWFQNAGFTITPAPLTITAEDKTKKQGTANPALTVSYNGLAEGDQPSDLETQPSVTTSAATGSQMGYYDIEVSGASSANYEISYVKGKLTIKPQTDESYNVKVWSPNPNQLQIKIYTERAQKAAIILYTETGQQVIVQQQQLAAGVNSFTMSVSHLASSTYILGVKAEQFKDSQKIRVK